MHIYTQCTMSCRVILLIQVQELDPASLIFFFVSIVVHTLVNIIKHTVLGVHCVRSVRGVGCVGGVRSVGGVGSVGDVRDVI